MLEKALNYLTVYLGRCQNIFFNIEIYWHSHLFVLHKVWNIKVGHTRLWPEGTSMLVLYVWNLVCKTIFHHRKREFIYIRNILQPWQILKIGSIIDIIRKYTSFLFYDLLHWMHSQFLPSKMIQIKRKLNF